MISTKNKKRVSKKNKNKTKKIVNCKNDYRAYTKFEDKFDKIYGDINSSKDFNLEKIIISDLKKAVNPSNIKPNEDFYSYVNDRWIQDTQIEENQQYIVQVDNFRLVQDKVYRELIEIIKEYISTNKSKQSIEIKNLYESLIKLNTDEQSRNYAKIRLQKIDHLRQNKANIWKMLGMANINEIISFGSPFQWSVNADGKDPKVLRCYVDGPQLSLIDSTIYIDDGTNLDYKNKYRKEYFKYLKVLFENAFGKNHGFNVDDIFQVEIKLIVAMLCTFTKGKISIYNKVTSKEALSKYKFDWPQFSKALGFKTTPDFFITSNLDYLKCGTELLLQEWDSEIFRTYWIYIYIRQQQRWNNNGLINNFNFSEKFVRGQDIQIDRALYPIFSMGFAFNTFLSNQYINKYKDDKIIDYITSLAEDLKTVFIRIIKRNKWLQPTTKAKALKKLYKFTLTIGYPEDLREDPSLQYSNNDAWGNMIQICHWRHKKAVQLEGKGLVDVPIIDWAQSPPKIVGTQPYIVNAMYFPAKNGIYLPLGYLQKPFIDL